MIATSKQCQSGWRKEGEVTTSYYYKVDELLCLCLILLYVLFLRGTAIFANWTLRN